MIFTCHGFKGGRLPPEVESLSETEQARSREICAEEAEQERLFREKSRQSFILPDSLSNSLGVAHTIGVFSSRDSGLVGDRGRVWLGHLTDGLDEGYGPVAASDVEGLLRSC